MEECAFFFFKKKLIWCFGHNIKLNEWKASHESKVNSSHFANTGTGSGSYRLPQKELLTHSINVMLALTPT